VRPSSGTGVHDPRSWAAGIPPLVDTTGSGAIRTRRRRRCRWCRGGVGSSIAGAHEGCHRSRRGGRCRSRRICGSTAAGVRGGWWLQYAPSAAIRAAFAVTERSRRGGFRSVGAEPQDRLARRDQMQPCRSLRCPRPPVAGIIPCPPDTEPSPPPRARSSASAFPRPQTPSPTRGMSLAQRRKAPHRCVPASPPIRGRGPPD
jgi:hypothetical protein